MGTRTAPTGTTRQGGDDARRPLTVKLAMGALGFVGATAVAGGVEMIAFPHGNDFVNPEWLETIPFVSTYRVPGLGLATGVGGTASLALVGLWRRTPAPPLAALERRTRQHWSWSATRLAGLALLAWLGLEVVVIDERSVIEAVYAATAVAILALSATTSFRAHTAPLSWDLWPSA